MLFVRVNKAINFKVFFQGIFIFILGFDKTFTNVFIYTFISFSFFLKLIKKNRKNILCHESYTTIYDSHFFFVVFVKIYLTSFI